MKQPESDTERPQFLTTNEISEITGVSVNTVRSWIDRGELPAHRLGRNFRIQAHDFQDFLDARRSEQILHTPSPPRAATPQRYPDPKDWPEAVSWKSCDTVLHDGNALQDVAILDGVQYTLTFEVGYDHKQFIIRFTITSGNQRWTDTTPEGIAKLEQFVPPKSWSPLMPASPTYQGPRELPGPWLDAVMNTFELAEACIYRSYESHGVAVAMEEYGLALVGQHWAVSTHGLDHADAIASYQEEGDLVASRFGKTT